MENTIEGIVDELKEHVGFWSTEVVFLANGFRYKIDATELVRTPHSEPVVYVYLEED